MTEELFVKIALGVISIVSALISAYVVPYLKSKKKYNEFAILNDYIVDAVRSANQLYTTEEWEQKKHYVVELVNDYLFNYSDIHLTEEHINAMIEGIVREVKIADKGVVNYNHYVN